VIEYILYFFAASGQKIVINKTQKQDNEHESYWRSGFNEMPEGTGR
jgi:hypothetical protein